MKLKFTHNRRYNTWEAETRDYNYQIMKGYCVTLDPKGQLVDVEEFGTTWRAIEQMERRINDL